MKAGWVLPDGYVYLASGAYTDVFVNRKQPRVQKVFRAEKPRGHVVQVFQSELAAYALATGHDATEAMIPGFHGQREVVAVTDEKGSSRTDLYHRDLVYELDWIDAYFRKIGTIDLGEATRIREAFWSVGIMHMTDASVAFVDGGRPKVIDFATKEFELWH